jgi:ribosomal-protein-alanine N-acetyltransferase
MDWKEIETERLVIRAYQPEDAPAFFRLASAVETTRYMVWPRHPDLAESKRVLEMFKRVLDGGGSTPLGLWSRADPGRLIGHSGFEKMEDAEPWVSWLLHPDAWGQGYAQEAVRALLDWGWTARPQWRCVLAPIHPANAASIRLAQRLGFREIPSELRFKMINLDGQVHAAGLWRLDRP